MPRKAPVPASFAGRKKQSPYFAGLTDLKQVIDLILPPWGVVAALFDAALLLQTADVGEDSPQVLVFDNRSLLNMPKLIKTPVRQLDAVVEDFKLAVRVVGDGDSLAPQSGRDR